MHRLGFDLRLILNRSCNVLILRNLDTLQKQEICWFTSATTSTGPNIIYSMDCSANDRIISIVYLSTSSVKHRSDKIENFATRTSEISSVTRSSRHCHSSQYITILIYSHAVSVLNYAYYSQYVRYVTGNLCPCLLSMPNAHSPKLQPRHHTNPVIQVD